MVKKSFHENLVELISKDRDFIKSLIEFSPDTILKNKYFIKKNYENYELDIYITSNLGESAIFEIKSHYGLRNHFLTKQYHRIIKNHPKSQVWLIYPNIAYDLNINDLQCERIRRLDMEKVDYI